MGWCRNRRGKFCFVAALHGTWLSGLEGHVASRELRVEATVANRFPRTHPTPCRGSETRDCIPSSVFHPSFVLALCNLGADSCGASNSGSSSSSTRSSNSNSGASNSSVGNDGSETSEADRRSLDRGEEVDEQISLLVTALLFFSLNVLVLSLSFRVLHAVPYLLALWKSILN